MSMKLIVGLGNPGAQYEQTRHNVGFLMLDALTEEHGLHWQHKAKFLSEIAEREIEDQKVVLAKPQTFMNKSGQAVRSLVDFYKLETHDVLVMHDDADMEWGKIRIVQISQSGGHRGIDSLVAHGLEGIWRLKIGVANKHRLPGQATDFVLARFADDEWSQLDRLYATISPIISQFTRSKMTATTTAWT